MVCNLFKNIQDMPSALEPPMKLKGKLGRYWGEGVLWKESRSQYLLTKFLPNSMAFTPILQHSKKSRSLQEKCWTVLNSDVGAVQLAGNE